MGVTPRRNNYSSNFTSHAIKSGGDRRSEAPPPAFPSPPRLRGPWQGRERGQRGVVRFRRQRTESLRHQSRNDALSRPCRATLPRRAGEGKASAGASSGVFPPLFVFPPLLIAPALREVQSTIMALATTRGGMEEAAVREPPARIAGVDARVPGKPLPSEAQAQKVHALFEFVIARAPGNWI
jgi:hypothetical protein